MDKLILELKPLLISLGEKLGQGGDFVWEAIMRQQYFDGFISLFWGIVGIILLVIGIKLILWVIREIKKDEYPDVCFHLFWIIPIVIFAFFFSGCNLETSFKKFTNPNYTALENIIDLVKPNN